MSAMAQATEAVLIVKEFLEGLNFPLAPQCIGADLQCMKGILASRDVSYSVGRMIEKFTRLFPDAAPKTDEPVTKTQEQYPKADPSLVQIVASKSEIDARIAAFIERKRMENDEINIQEFTDMSRASQADGMTCARVRPVTLPRFQTGGRVKLVRQQPVSVAAAVSAAEGKISVSDDHDSVAPASRSSADISGDIANRRCLLLEGHLGLPAAVRSNIYDRLKCVERRVLELEARSPEYLSHVLSKSRGAGGRLHSSSAGMPRGRRRCNRSLLASHPYRQGSTGYFSAQPSASALSRRTSDEESASSSFGRSLQESLNMKPLERVS